MAEPGIKIFTEPPLEITAPLEREIPSRTYVIYLGQEIAGWDGDPWEYEATFQVWRFVGEMDEGVDFDISTNAGWEFAAGLAIPSAPSLPDWELVDTQTTNVGGDHVLVFDNLELGLYLVVETDSGHPDVDPIAPFFVTIPLFVNDSWLLDVFVYPKNFEDPELTVTKGVDGPHFIGDVATWTIDSTIPVATNADELLTGVNVIDRFHSALAPDYETVIVQIVDGDDVIATLTDFDAVLAGGVLTVSIDESHPASVALLRDNPGATLRVIIESEILPEAAGQYIINSAETTWFHEEGETGPIEPTDPPSLDFRGSLNIVKHHFEDVAELLAGAQFRVFTTRDAAVALDGDYELTTAPLTTGDDGAWAAALAGLPVGATVYLREIAAPDGFILLAEPVAVVISGVGGLSPTFEWDEVLGDWVMVDEGVDADVTIQYVANVPEDGGSGNFRLPMTGGAGVAMFTIIGLGAAGVLVALFTRKKAAA
ncbi:MAG: SpaH/EbpB family LPXTG-anchored major pilin [Promicromonosporaceae bacterium]|nr:SpaH/EbpB family LPXTG-anchored major pilin [Promicromonosporaceae bacterium]